MLIYTVMTVALSPWASDAVKIQLIFHSMKLEGVLSPWMGCL